MSTATPELSWILPSEWTTSDATDIQAVVGGVLLERSELSSTHRFVAWPWAPLKSRDRVRWRVRARARDTVSTWSEWAEFEAGLFEDDWSAAWISSPNGSELAVGERPAYQFVREFVVEGNPYSARLYASALGLYDAEINGNRVGRTELAPGSESYDKTLYAQAYDVTTLLHAGTNILRLTLSDGWFRGRAGAFRHQAAWGDRTAIRAEVHIDADTGSTVVAATDATWDVFDSPVVMADLMDGQKTDFQYEPRLLGPAMPGPIAPAVSWSPAPPVRVVAELLPRTVRQLDEKTLIIDFGQNASGRVRLRSLGPAGTRTQLDYGEHLSPQGDLTLAHLDTPAPDGTSVPFVQHDEVISDGRDGSTFEPRHTVHGFQYVRLLQEGILADDLDIVMQVMHTDFPSTGSFMSSDFDLNALYNVADWSFRGNAVDVPTDCPTRERAGWTGDYQIFLPTAVRLYDVDGFSRKWLQSVRDDQLADGRIVNISPDNERLGFVPNPMSDMATGSAGWGDAIVIVPWELYRTYGDRAVLADNWNAMVRWVEFARNAAAENRHPSRVNRSEEPQPHERYLWDGTFHFGEWLEPTPLNEDGTPGPTMPDPMAWAMADKGEVGTAYLYRSASILALVASALGKAEQSEAYANFAGQVKAAWQKEFLTEAGHLTVHSQAAHVRALSFDLLPDNARASVARRLVNLIEADGMHLGTGFLSTADLLPTLTDSGYPEVAHAVLWQRTNPSWLGMLDRGATTIWEEWEGVDRNGTASASLNHYSKGAVIRYLQTHILGLRQAPESVAWQRFVVAPVIPDHLTWASGHFDSPQGRIEVRWRNGPESSLTVSVPGGSVAVVEWNGVEREVGPGEHLFSGAMKPVEIRRAE